ncbi:sphinganine C4-monooxygenase 1-like isoform X2 [Asparagus officinalis]|uniref:sphinganine C4-monooxygenase 1-like isoform X2 n=1 Tax=Asparagus officinalis TaxID=4686 RepID=UPI00098DEDEB|nr:sphinganine C4-monooxygenase 1-like isoform X2 [Asparagus officinalis]
MSCLALSFRLQYTGSTRVSMFYSARSTTIACTPGEMKTRRTLSLSTPSSKVIEGGKAETHPQPPLHVIIMQFMVAMFVLDTWQYFMHRYMHMNKFLYKHIHSNHHRLIVPYAYGALYNHPLEGLLLDTVGGVLSFLISGMTPRTSIFFFSFATIKSINDHCGLWLPGNPLNLLFDNNSAYHDVHHQLYGNKYNFSQPFFVVWDRVLGTYMPYTLEERKEGGLEARPIKD